MNARIATKQRRAAIERRRGPTMADLRARLPLNTQVAHVICGAFYHECACVKAPDKPICERMEGAARSVIDLVRNHDSRRSA